MLTAFVVLRSHNDNEMRCHRNTPTHFPRHKNYLNCTRVVQPFDNTFIQWTHRLMVISDPVHQCLHQRTILNSFQVWFQLFLGDMTELIAGISNQLIGGNSTLSSIRNEYHRRTIIGQFVDGEVRWFRHCEHQRWEVGNMEFLEPDFEWIGTRFRTEIEDGVLGAANPFTEVEGVGERYTQSDNTDFMFELSGDETHSRDDDFIRWTDVSTYQMDLVGDEQFHRLNILPLFPASRD